MSTTIHFSLISNPQLLDVVDEEWMQDKLEDDGELVRIIYLTDNKSSMVLHRDVKAHRTKALAS